MNKQAMKDIAQAYEDQMKAIRADFPVTEEGKALAVWTRMTPNERYEIMAMIEKMPKTLPAKQKACVKKIAEIIKA